MIIRPIVFSDLPALQQIAKESGPGFTSLMDDRDFLIRKIQNSLNSFSKAVDLPGKESYLFVLEDPETGDVMGTTGIEASVGLESPLYHYRKSRVVHQSRELDLFRQADVLNMCNHYTGCSEVCTLFLRPRFRQAHAGKLLSKVRFLFMAQHPQRFSSMVIAEMRGVCDEQGQSPFWSWLREHFIDLDFDAITRLVGAGQNRFVADLMPKYPLYTHLLSPEAQRVIGHVHEKTRPALRLLEAEGFEYAGYVDLFDAGPTVEAPIDRIRSVAESIECPVRITNDDERPAIPAGSDNVIAITNTGTTDFRATVAEAAVYSADENWLQVPASVARTLNLVNDMTVRFIRLPTSRPIHCTNSIRYHTNNAQEHSHAPFHAI